MDACALPAASLFEAFIATASRAPNGIAWLAANPHETRPAWTWSEIGECVHRTAQYLNARGVGKGDRVANTGRNCAQWAILDLACSSIGAIHAPIDSRYPAAWMERCLNSLEAKILFSDPDAPFHRGIPLASLPGREARSRKGPISMESSASDLDDAACILFTSGTTLDPRGVVLTHRNLLSNGLAKLDAMPQAPDDLRMNLLPFSHAYARTCELTAWMLAGGTMACVYGVEEALAAAPRLRPQLINAVPLFYEVLERRARATSGSKRSTADLLGGSVRRLASGGAPLRKETRQGLEQIGFPIFQGYGLTEASPVVCSNRDSMQGAPPILEGVGPTVSGVRIRIDSDRRIWVSGDGVMQGYWRNPEATASRIIDGWLDTGDLATSSTTQAHAPLAIEGRCDEVQVLANGYKFSPRPLEQQLLSGIDGLEYCVLLGSGRHQPLLAVQLAPGFEHLRSSEILGRARDILSEVEDYARPTLVWIEPETWSVANGCLHWKGGINRRAILRRIDAAGSE